MRFLVVFPVFFLSYSLADHFVNYSRVSQFDAQARFDLLLLLFLLLGIRNLFSMGIYVNALS